MSPDPRPDAKQVIRDALETSQIGISLTNNGWVMDASESAAAVVAALRVAGLPVGPVDALRYAEERLLEDANVEAASRAFEPDTWDDSSWPEPEVRATYRADALELSHAAISEAFRSARGEGT